MVQPEGTCAVTVRRLGLLVGVVFTLACGGLVGGPSEEQGYRRPPNLPNPDRLDKAEQLRLLRDYGRAQKILESRIRKNPEDHHAHRLLGDVNLSRGQDYTRKWKENLARAYDAYAEAVRLKPDDCTYWARLGTTVTMAYQNDQTRIPRTTLERLPMDLGWENCASAALLELELSKQPTEEELQAAAEQTDDAYAQLNLAAPWLQDAWARAPLSHITEWVEGPGKADFGAGRPFVVIDPPMTAKGQGHSYDRAVSGIERFTTGRVSDGRVVFVDRRFPEKIPASAVVRAPACKHTSWNDNGPDGVAVGRCTSGTFMGRNSSPLYNPSILKVAGPGHYTHASISRATIPGEEVLWDSVKCSGGKIGRKLEYTPTCPVTYDKPNWLTRWLPSDRVYPTRDDAHANQVMTAAGMKPIWGEEITERMVRGDLAVGMPYSMFRYALPNLRGCLGRAVLAKHLINGGELEFTCAIDDKAYMFVDLQLVWFGPIDDLLVIEEEPEEDLE